MDDLIRTRKEELEELVRLNEKLRIYIEKNAVLESENKQLKEVIKKFENNENNDNGDKEYEYNKQLDNLRKQLNDAVRDKNKALFDAEKYKTNYDKLLEKNNKLEELVKINSDIVDRLSEEKNILIGTVSEQDKQIELSLENNKELNCKNDLLTQKLMECKEHCKKLNEENSDFIEKIKKLEENNFDLNKRNDSLVDENDELKKIIRKLELQVNEDGLEKNDLKKESDLLRLKLSDCEKHGVELHKNNAMLNDNLDRMKRRYNQLESENNDLKNELRNSEFNKKDLTQIIDDLRLDVEDLKQKIVEINDRHNHENQILIMKTDQLERARQIEFPNQSDDNVFSFMNQKIEAQLNELRERDNKRYKELAEIMENKYKKEIHSFKMELEREKEEHEKLQIEFQRLFDFKISLERELTVLRNLLESVDERSNISTISDNSESFQKTSKPNYCIFSDNFIIITQHDQDKIIIFNTSEKDFKLPAGSKLRVSTIDDDPKVYVFANDVLIKSKQSFKIWTQQNFESNLSNNDLETDFEYWPTGKYMEATLLDNDDNVIAFKKSLFS